VSEPRTLSGCLDRAARTEEGVRFLDRKGETFVSYREMAERARRVAGGLRELGVQPSQRVAIVAPTSIDFYDAFLGISYAGAVPAPLALPPRFGGNRDWELTTTHRLRSADVRLVLAGGATRYLKAMQRAAPECPCRPVEALLGKPPHAMDVDEDTIALVQFSSGTTSSPKPVALTHRQVLANARRILGVFFDAYPEHTGVHHAGVSWLPLYHDMGLVGAMLTALVCPGPLALMTPETFIAKPSTWLRAISDYRATVSASPNFGYEHALSHVGDGDLDGVDLSCWRLALDGAELVTAATLRRFYERFRAYGFREEALTPVYGLAEASLAVTFSDPRRPHTVGSFDPDALYAHGEAVPLSGGHEIVSCGTPLRDFSVRITDHDRAPLPECRVGHVLVRGPSVMSGYLDQAESTQRVLVDGWLDTGDRGFLLDGELYLCGRYKDAIVVNGRNHAPEVFERALEGVEAVRPGCVAAVPFVTESGEHLALLAELRSDASEGERSSIAEIVRSRVASETGLVPERVLLLRAGALPRTSSGKLRRAEAARRWLGEAHTF
jgi:fatty-acyl-CoA synthase